MDNKDDIEEVNLDALANDNLSQDEFRGVAETLGGAVNDAVYAVDKTGKLGFVLLTVYTGDKGKVNMTSLATNGEPEDVRHLLEVALKRVVETDPKDIKTKTTNGEGKIILPH